MSFFPLNPNIAAARRMQSDVLGRHIEYALVAHYALTAAEAATADVDYFMVSTDMKVGNYGITAKAMPGNCARNVTVTHTASDTADTLGTIKISGTDLAGNAIDETLTPTSGGTKAGAKAFRTVTKVEGAGWVVDAVEETADKITVGFGELIGLPDLLPYDTLLCAVKDVTKEATAPTVTCSTTALSANTVDLNSTLDGDTIDLYYLV